jgi:putative ABC transport system substrate-binding protein
MQFDHLKRREFIAFLGAGLAPLIAHAQQPAGPVIGFISSGSAAAFAPFVARATELCLRLLVGV